MQPVICLTQCGARGKADSRKVGRKRNRMMSVSGSDRIRSALRAAAGSDAVAGLVLIVMTSVAMIAANSPVAAGYHALFHARLFASAGLAAEVPLPDLQAWINEALMAVFFFTVGLEIKREALIGDLATPARRRLPILAAVTGMIVPALVYLACIRGIRDWQRAGPSRPRPTSPLPSACWGWSGGACPLPCGCSC